MYICFMKINTQHVILILLSLIILNNIITWFTPKGMSSYEHELKIKLHDLKQDKAILEKENNQLEYKIKSFENEIHKIDSTVDNADIHQLDSMYTAFFAR